MTLFELTVVNNWYITMVRSKHLHLVTILEVRMRVSRGRC